MRTRFYIERRKNREGRLLLKDRPVFMSVTFGGERVMIGTGLKVDLHGWDTENQMVKENYPGSKTMNRWLEMLVDAAGSAWHAMTLDEREPDPEIFRSIFMELKPKYSSGFFDVFYLFLESGSSRWSISSYRKVRIIYNHLREFEKKTGYSISFSNLNRTFLEKFTRFYSEKGNGAITTYKAINILVWFLNWATQKGYNIYIDYRKFYRMLEGPGQPARKQIFLQWEELMKILDHHPGNRKMERARDLFCFMCLSGIRFSEIQDLKKEDIVGEAIRVRKKGGNIRCLPMNQFTQQIYGKYENRYYLDNTAFPQMSNITMNKYLRMIGMEVGLERKVPAAPRSLVHREHDSFAKGSESARVPLYKRLTAGIAVNTFIANAIQLDIPVEIISVYTGVQHDSRIKHIKAELAAEEMKKFDRRKKMSKNPVRGTEE